jgi:hypothetical protein
MTKGSTWCHQVEPPFTVEKMVSRYLPTGGMRHGMADARALS